MRMWAFLAAALLTSLVLAGCSDDNDNGDGDSTSSTSSSPSSTSTSSSSTSSSSSTTSSSSTSTSTGPTGNRAPTGSISASVSNGSLPLSVNFTVDATDADGDHLAWDLDFGDGSRTNGTVVPATVTHEYATVGNYTASYVVSDGKLQSSYSVAINVSAGGGGASFTIQGESAGLDPTADEGLPMIGGCLFAESSETPGSGGAFHAVDAVIDGWAWVLTATYHVWFYDNDLVVLGDGVEAGTVPAGTTQLAICTADPGNLPTGTYTFTATEA